MPEKKTKICKLCGGKFSDYLTAHALNEHYPQLLAVVKKEMYE